MKRLIWCCFALVLLWPLAVQAHHPALSSLIVEVQPNKIDTLLELDAVALGELLKLDTDGNNIVDQDEFIKGQTQVLAYIDRGFSIKGDDQPCLPGAVERYLLGGRLDKLRVLRVYTCPTPPATLIIHHELLMEMTGGHSHVAQVQLGEDIQAHIFDPDNRSLTLDVSAATGAIKASPAEVVETVKENKGWWSLFSDFLWQGVLHILLGFDHILFVLVLVVAVTRFKDLAAMVTAFTLAHSITLALGALQIVDPDPSIIESIIALSIIYVAVENLVTDEPKARYVVSFFFGLVHGFGFSGVLRGLGLPEDGLLPSLLAFNLGVELGQLAIVAPVFPLLWKLRQKNEDWHRRATLAFSIPVLLIALIWFIERAFSVSILPNIGN